MKHKFIEELKRYLSGLTQEERDEIIRFYEERFHTGMLYEGKSEQEIIDEMESPKDIARNVLEEYGIPFQEKPNEQKASNNNVGSIIAVVILDVLFISWFVPFLFSLFFGLGAGFLAGLATLIVVATSLEVPMIIYGLMLGIGLLYFWVLLVIWFYDIMVGFIGWVVKIHVDAFSINNTYKISRKTRRLKSDYIVNKYNLRRTRRLITLVALVLTIVGGMLYVTEGGSISAIQMVGDIEEYTEYIEMGEGDIKIVTNMEQGSVRILRHQGDRIRVEVNESENYPNTIEFVDGTLTIENDSGRRFPWLTFDFTWFSQTQVGVTIYLPDELDVSHISLDNMNGLVSIDTVDVDALTVNITNGNVILRDVESDTGINIETTNGKIDLNNVVLETTLDAETTNGEIVLQNVTGQVITLQTTNGSVNLNDINLPDEGGNSLNVQSTNGRIRLNNVYISNVILQTTNGSIDFYNQDRSFFIDHVDANTTNGSKDIDVPRN